MNPVLLKKLGITEEEFKERWNAMKAVREMARTNLLYLCREILGYRDVSKEVHGEILDMLQHFKGGWDRLNDDGSITYTPKCQIQDLPSQSRNTLILFPRNHFKTSIITIAHTIQWIINYPDIRVALSMAIGDQTQKVMKELKGHFQYTRSFRKYFPEFCPSPKKISDFGNMEEFTVPNRSRNRKEPTVCLITIGKVIAGSHYDVVKHSDLVDENNVKTPNQIADVISHFGHMDPLLERYPSKEKGKLRQAWQDVEGTRYDFGDLYGVILSKPEGWRTLVRGAYKDDGTTLDMLRYPPEELDRIKDKPEMTPYIFSCQYLNRPVAPEGGLCDPNNIVFVPHNILDEIRGRLRIHCTVDLHGLDASKTSSDFTVLNVHGFDRDGRLYVIDVRCGRFNPSEFVWHFFDIFDRYPSLIDFKVERVVLWEALKATLRSEMERRRKFPVLVDFPRDTRISKQQRIRALQPWFKSQRIRFSDDLSCRKELVLEVTQFPSQSAGCHDDILDTCADALQNDEGEMNVDVIPDALLDPRYQFGAPRPKDKFLGFDDQGTEMWLYQETKKMIDSPTGVL